ncbi:MAG TPA: nuclear transport factor 2 family protein [Solirubrobacteraceae bacterium]|nr:nuclear transport factor 2 family protein [Solirubrobacteraceae bacterium]
MQEKAINGSSSPRLRLAAAAPGGVLPGTPEHNIQLHARAVAAMKAGEVPSEILAPGFYMRNCASSVSDYTYRGESGWRDWMEDLFEEFTGKPRYELEQIVATGDDYVVAEYCIRGRSARSGKPLAFRWAGVTWFARGALTRVAGYASRREALEAVGAESVAQEGSSGVHEELLGVQTATTGPHPGHDEPGDRPRSKAVRRLTRDGDKREGSRGDREKARH